MPWRTTLLDLLSTRSFATQGEIVRALADAGHTVTQATVSRTLSALGITKVDGQYRPGAAADVGAPIHAVLVSAQQALVVVKTDPAHAAFVARAIDGAVLKGVLGTIAGDDTVFVAVADPRATERLKRHLGWPARP